MDGGVGKAGRDRPSSRSHPYDKRKESSGRSGPPPDERTENKLYVGNLDHRVTEYHVIKMFTPYGKIRREEYLWHTYGPKRGEPRGYAFVEYSKREEAELARSKMNGRMVFGRPLVVRFVDEKVVTYNTDAPVWNRNTSTTTAAPATAAASAPGAPGAAGAAGLGRGGGGGGAAVATASAADSAKRARVAAIQSKLRAMEQEDRQRKQGQAPKTMNMIRPPPSGFGGGFPPGAGRGDGGDGGGGDRAGGEGRGAGGGYSRTLLQSGTRWSSWG